MRLPAGLIRRCCRFVVSGHWHSANVRFFHRQHADKTSGAPLIFEKHHAGNHSEKAVVLSQADVASRLITSAALANQNAAPGDQLAAEALDAKPLSVGIAAVCG